MSEEDLEVLITLDDPGEDDLEEDTLYLQSEEIAPRSSEHQQSGDLISNNQK